MMFPLKRAVLLASLLFLKLACVRPNGDLVATTPDLGGSGDVPDAAAPPPTFAFSTTPDRVDFGVVAVGESTSRTVRVANRTSALHALVAIELAGDGADQLSVVGCVQSYTPGAECDVALTYAPTRSGSTRAELRLTDDAGVVAGVGITAGAQPASSLLSVTPKDHDFPALEVGSSALVTVAITNTSNGPLAAGPVLGGDDGFSVATNCPATLPAGNGCGATITFAPKRKGSFSAVLTVAGTQRVTVRGTGLSPAKLSMTADGSFVDQFVGDPAQTVTYHVVNNGGDPTCTMTVALTTSQPPQFAIVADGCNGHPLDGGAACDVRVTFAPTASGLATMQLTVAAAPGGSQRASSVVWARLHASLFLQIGNPDFGTVHDDRTSQFTFENDSDEATGPLTVAIPNSATSGFSIVAGSASTCVGANLAPWDVCTVTIKFATHVVGTFTDELRITGAPLPTTTWPLHAQFSATSALRMRPFYISLESSDGKPQTRRIVVENVQTHDVGPLSTSVSGAPFSITADACADVTLPSGGSCVLSVTLTPTANGTFSGKVHADAGADGVIAAVDATVHLPSP